MDPNTDRFIPHKIFWYLLLTAPSSSLWSNYQYSFERLVALAVEAPALQHETDTSQPSPSACVTGTEFYSGLYYVHCFTRANDHIRHDYVPKTLAEIGTILCLAG